MHATQVSDHLAGCLLKSVYQNPDNGFSSDRALDRDDVRRLVRHGGEGGFNPELMIKTKLLFCHSGSCHVDSNTVWWRFFIWWRRI